MIDSNPEAGVPAVFFPGQLLELMRWAARYGKNGGMMGRPLRRQSVANVSSRRP
jgi:hypothetical protein